MKSYILFDNNAYAIPCSNWREAMGVRLEIESKGMITSVTSEEGIRNLYPHPVIVDYALASILSQDNAGIVKSRIHLEHPIC